MPETILVDDEKTIKVSKALRRILSKAQTPKEFEDWCVSVKLLQPMDIAMIAKDEGAIQEKILTPCKTGKGVKIEEVAVEVAIRKAWVFCREALTHSGLPEKKELEPDEAQDLDTRWHNAGNMPLSTRERVGSPLMKKLFSMVSAEPVQFEICLLEQITLFCAAPKVLEQVVKNADGGLGFQAQQIQATTSAFEVIDKVRAYLSSLSYASCENPEWCAFPQVRSSVEDISMKVRAAEHHCAPMSFYNDAYLASAQVWQNKIVLEKLTMTAALSASQSWMYLWDYRCPGCVNCDPSVKGKGRGGLQAAGKAIEGGNRQQRKTIQNYLWQTMQRFQKTVGKGAGGPGGGKGQFGWPVQKAPFQKTKGAGKGGDKGKDKGKGGKDKGKQKGWTNRQYGNGNRGW